MTGSNRYVCSFKVDKEEYDSTEKAFQIAKVDYAIEQQNELQLNEKEILTLITKRNDAVLEFRRSYQGHYRPSQEESIWSLDQRRAQQSPKPK